MAEDEDEELEVEEPPKTRQSVAPVEQVEAPVKKKKSFSSLMSFIRIPSKRNKNKKLEASQKQVETQEVRQSAVSSGFNRGVASKGKNKFTQFKLRTLQSIMNAESVRKVFDPVYENGLRNE